MARTLAGLGRWAYGVSADGVWIHLYGGNTLQTKLPNGATIALTQQTDYPWGGRVKITVTMAPPEPLALRLRIPGWAERAAIKVNRQAVAATVKPGTYAHLARLWSPGDVIELDLPLAVRLMEAHPAIEACRDRVAVMRGPVVYCLEAPKAQDGEALWNQGVFLPENVTFTPRHDRTFLGGVTVLDGQALTGKGRTVFMQHNTGVAPSKSPDWRDALYRTFAPCRLSPPTVGTVDITLIPYFVWANRGPSLMEVWIPLAK